MDGVEKKMRSNKRRNVMPHIKKIDRRLSIRGEDRGFLTGR
jgi:hypothetical protein